MTTEITRIKQVDGTMRVIHAQDVEHAARAKDLLRADSALIDRLDGIDGIKVSVYVDHGTATEAKKIDKLKITMSERRPLTIAKADWPIIAKADWHNGQLECQANTIRRIRVREHADGRRIVYGLQCEGNGGQYAGTRNPEGGFLIEPAAAGKPNEEETVRAIRRVGGIVDDDALADECIADLPAEEV